MTRRLTSAGTCRALYLKGSRPLADTYNLSPAGEARALGRPVGGRMIRLVGPGGAGKSTVGALLAQRLDVPFVDLDEEFVANVGDISLYLSSHRYDAYAKRNVEVYFSLVSVVAREAVLALSSGFMAYRRDVHPDYESCRRDIASSPSTFVLLPSLDFEACVAETVRRQLIRPFARSADSEEQVIRARYHVYLSIPAKTVETMRPASEVVDELVAQQGVAAAETATTRDANLSGRVPPFRS